MPDSRELALLALKDVLKKGLKPKDAIERNTKGGGEIDRRDRAFLMELVYGVVRHRDTLDWILRKFLIKSRMPSIDTLNNLRTGTFQIFYMRVPDWAAVNEAVKLEKRHKGLANAVLRNVLRGRREIESELSVMKESIDESKSHVADISVLTSHPEWLIRRWSKRLGPMETFEIAEANNRHTTLTLRVNTLRATREEVLKKLNGLDIEAEPTPLCPDGVLLKEHLAYSELESLSGLVLAQDEAAQLMSYMLAPKPGERVLDTCSAPGGKTTHMAQLMEDTGEIIAMDTNRQRIDILKENVLALGLDSIKVVHADITEYKESGLFDSIMLDAPCSALGTIRRNPDIKYRHVRKDLARFKEKQTRMLTSAAGLLRPGGKLLYCTCSTEPEEGEEIVKEFLKTSEEFYIIKDLHDVVKPMSSDGFLRTWPHRHGTDGFFGALLKRED
jgi:16S rRNA (cytosine967-C5)-methyltransferase